MPRSLLPYRGSGTVGSLDPMTDQPRAIPLLTNKYFRRPSVFAVENLLREARRQRGVAAGSVPEICVLDPDGDLWRELRAGTGRLNAAWACYHTEMYEWDLPGATVGVVGCAVGAPFAALVAEEMFASGCRLLVSVTSAGQLEPVDLPSPYFVLIDRALRDEGTSYHYVPPSDYICIGADALAIGKSVVDGLGDVAVGGAWTTDAPFRETEEAIAFARGQGLLAVEMEAAGLYALSAARGFPIVCFAHVTNQMAVSGDDFEKGADSGNAAFRRLMAGVVGAWKGA